MSNLWAGMKDAQLFERGNYFKPGLFDVRVTRCMVKQTMRSGLGFIAELEILDSNTPEHAVGSTGTWFQGMTNQATAFSAIKEFVIAIHGFDPKRDKNRIAMEIDPYLEQWMAAATGPDNAFAGRCAHLETFTIKTKEKKLDFTVHRWTPYTGDPALLSPIAARVATIMHGTAPAPAGPPPFNYGNGGPGVSASTPFPYGGPPAQAYPPPQAYPPAQAYPPQGGPPPQAYPPQAQAYPPPQAGPPGPPPQPVWDPVTRRYVLPAAPSGR